MKIADALRNVSTVAFDSSPIIYYIENHPIYAELVQEFVDRLNGGMLIGYGSTLLLTEVLVQPIRLNNQSLITAYEAILLNSQQFSLSSLDHIIARQAATLRAKYNLKTPDAIHVANAIATGADAFLTNDIGIRRVTEIDILILDELAL